jgi:hypothetical protein
MTYDKGWRICMRKVHGKDWKGGMRKCGSVEDSGRLEKMWHGMGTSHVA